MAHTNPLGSSSPEVALSAEIPSRLAGLRISPVTFRLPAYLYHLLVPDAYHLNRACVGVLAYRAIPMYSPL